MKVIIISEEKMQELIRYYANLSDSEKKKHNIHIRNVTPEANK